jgi:hypothetical protein
MHDIARRFAALQPADIGDDVIDAAGEGVAADSRRMRCHQEIGQFGEWQIGGGLTSSPT